MSEDFAEIAHDVTAGVRAVATGGAQPDEGIWRTVGGGDSIESH